MNNHVRIFENYAEYEASTIKADINHIVDSVSFNFDIQVKVEAALKVIAPNTTVQLFYVPQNTFKQIEIDGIAQSLPQDGMWTFEDEGEHSIKYVLDDPNTIGENAFKGCENIESVNIPKDVTNIGNEAFYDCTNLVDVTLNSDTPPTIGVNVFENNASGRVIYVPKGSEETYKEEDNWNEYSNDIMPSGEHDYSKDYLTFTAIESGTFKFSGNSISYSLDDGGTWTSLANNTNSPTVNAGDKILWKGELTPASNGIGTFLSTAKFDIEGNVMSLLYGDNFVDQTSLEGKNNAFMYLFNGATNAVNAENLSLLATTLTYGCYQYMFFNCTSLTTAPQLPATTLAQSCYSNMFFNCTSLTTVPQLPATTLAESCYYQMFFNCTSLTTVPQLPATTLAYGCYQYMFYNCSSLTTAPQLQATTLADYCYRNMFYNCTSLTTAPQLQATTLASSCYSNMFNGCTSLTTAPQLPATTLAQSCYYNMFNGCSSLTTAPQLPAPTLATNCYSNMFHDCSSLTTAPQLQATTLADYCYYNMFYRCSNLTTAPQLPATTLVNSCYDSMFYHCSSLTTAPQLLATTLAEWCYNGMFYNCTSISSVTISNSIQQETFIECFNTDSKVYITNDNMTIPSNAFVRHAACGSLYLELGSKWITDDALLDQFIGWKLYVDNIYIGIIEKKGGGYYYTQKDDGYTKFSPTIQLTPQDYVTFSALTDGSIGLESKSDYQTVYFSKDGNMWQEVNAKDNFKLNSGDYFLVCGMLTNNNSIDMYTQFAMSGSIYSSGDFNAIWNYSNVDAPLKEYCGYRMFNNCTSLTEAPQLPSTTLATNCYYQMFRDCTNLTTAPQLPATTLANGCYYQMFAGCSSLTTAPQLQATTLANGCYYGMFSNCTSLTTAPQLQATTLASYCYENMFYNCSSLTTAPQLLATTLTDSCYRSMFSNCTSLTTAPQLQATTLANYCCQYMFYNCSSLTTAPQLPATTLAPYCYYQMFVGCSSLTTAPQLQATTLAERCYYYMFYGCSRLNSITCLATDISASNCTNNWVYGVASNGTFTEAEGMARWTSGYNGIPTNWTVIDASA